MNIDEPECVERELSRLTPAQPDGLLMQRLRCARQKVCAAPRSRSFADEVSRWFAEWWWIPVGATGVLVVGLTLGQGEVGSTTHEPEMAAGYTRKVFTPETVDNYLVDAQDLGIFLDEQQRPYKLVRATWVDEAQFTGDDGTSRMLVTDAREQFIPVALEVY
jgi:hypothetical protein